MKKATPVNIPLAWGTLSGMHWPNPGAPKLLCLHGWLDNAASFVPLAHHLQDFDLYAIDLAGHGFSAHRPPHSRYYFSENIYDLDAALDQLGWDSCHLMGHSMGGAVACHFAAAAPERVNRLVSLDAVGIFTQAEEKCGKQWQMSLRGVRKSRGFLRPYESVEQAMAARQVSSPLSDQAARLLCERALEHNGDYYQWRTDQRLNWRSPQILSNKQAVSVLSVIEAPTLTINSAYMSKYLSDQELADRFAAIKDGTHVDDPGHHHFHMETPEKIGPIITEFLLKDAAS